MTSKPPPRPRLPPPRPPQRITSSGVRPAFQDTEAATPSRSARVITYGEISSVLDRAYERDPARALLMLELLGYLADMPAEDADLTLRVAARLAQGARSRG